MKKYISFSFLFFICFISLLISQEKLSPEDLPPKYRKWLQEEVVHIITPTEKDVFLQLKNDRERDLFIKAFWEQRDPKPGTPENEFKEEHYRRINYANKRFGRGTPTPGWRTERGRIYIILGEPQEIQRYESLSQVYPTIVWFYQGMSEYGLPDAFNVVFFKKYGAGDYQLYSPVQDGPQNLLIHYMGDPKDYLAAYQKLRSIQPQLAEASYSLLPSEPIRSTTPSIASEILLGNIEEKPQESVKDQYAEKLLKYKDIIEVEYTANYMDNNHLVSVISDAQGQNYVHYLIEPENLSVNFDDGQYYTTLEVSGKVSDLDGKNIYQFNKQIPIRFGKDQLQKIQSNPFSFQDVFPLVEGHYQVHILMKNQVSKEFTSFERDLIVSSDTSKEITPLLMAPHKKEAPATSSHKPYQVGDVRLYPSPQKEFTGDETLTLFFQIPGLKPERRENGYLQYTFYKGDEEFKKEIKKIQSYPHTNYFLEEFSLQDFPPAHYNVEVSLLNQQKEKVVFDTAYFGVSPVEHIPRPFIYSETAPSPLNPLTDYILGGQYFNKGNFEKAKEHLEKAYQQKPQSLTFALGLSRLLFQEKKFEKVQEILTPFAEGQPENYSFLKILGDATQNLQQYQKAIEHYQRYISHVGTNLDVLNSIGICHSRLGNEKKALKAFEKSLEINPKQKKIKRLVSSLKQKK
ncbi:GWxTD domain-containing protein [bacterium]|nr:GWxTD domain-containing protein [bacterium]